MNKSIFIFPKVSSLFLLLIFFSSCGLGDNPKNQNDFNKKTSILPSEYYVKLPASITNSTRSSSNMQNYVASITGVIDDSNNFDYSIIRSAIQTTEWDNILRAIDIAIIDNICENSDLTDDVISASSIIVTDSMVEIMKSITPNNIYNNIYDVVKGREYFISDFVYKKSDDPMYDRVFEYLYLRDYIPAEQDPEYTPDWESTTKLYWKDDKSLFKSSYYFFNQTHLKLSTNYIYDGNNKKSTLNYLQSMYSSAELQESKQDSPFVEFASLTLMANPSSNNNGVFFLTERHRAIMLHKYEFYRSTSTGYSDDNGGIINSEWINSLGDDSSVDIFKHGFDGTGKVSYFSELVNTEWVPGIGYENIDVDAVFDNYINKFEAVQSTMTDDSLISDNFKLVNREKELSYNDAKINTNYFVSSSLYTEREVDYLNKEVGDLSIFEVGAIFKKLIGAGRCTTEGKISLLIFTQNLSELNGTSCHIYKKNSDGTIEYIGTTTFSM